MGKTEKELFIEWLKIVNTATTTLINKLEKTETTNNFKGKYKVIDFAKLIGCSQKTVYAIMKRNEVKFITERIRGRKITFIIASEDEIQQLRKFYVKNL